MKNCKQYLLLLLIAICATGSLQAQEEEKRPEFLVVTTMHWNMDQEDYDFDDWKALEKEYLDKVVMKNELIAGASFFMHQFTEDNSELLYVQVFNSWNDIHAAAERSNELAKEAWPDEEARNAFFKKQGAFYSMQHSDEIYATMDGAKALSEMPTKDMTLYLQKRHFAFPEDGSMKEWEELNKAYQENIVHKNEYIKGYYPNRHYYGADRTEFLEAFYVDSLTDLDKMLDRLGELPEEAWPDEASRKEMGEKMSKYYTGIHSDYIYTYVSGLSK
ncbi:hypothetical protein [Lutimonas sp.]|jgi:hypothetical protein|uniref:hypothetical protein n=1 Tax=Lutimonas sp. TaxID=1872403 RepID=UPI003C717728